MRFLVLSALLLGIVLFSGCGKERGSVTVTGRLLDAISQEPVPQARVGLYQKWDKIISPKPDQEVETGTDGSFTFRFTTSEDRMYYLSASRDAYWKAPYVYVTERKHTTQDLQLDYKAWIRTVYVNDPPLGPIYSALVTDPVTGAVVYPSYGNHALDSLQIIAQAYGGRENAVEYYYWAGSAKIKGWSEAVYCPAQETTAVYIHY